MQNNIKTHNKKGFTLLEILLVIAVIGILASIVLVAINPTRQISQARMRARQVDMKNIAEAIEVYTIKNQGKSIENILGPQSICQTGTETVGGSTDCTGYLDLRELVPKYIANIPKADTGNYILGKEGDIVVVKYEETDLWKIAGNPIPALDLNFARDKQLTNAVTGISPIAFTRASEATYIGSDGLIKTAAINQPRFTHDPITKESLGLLVEGPGTNLIYPSDIGNIVLNDGGGAEITVDTTIQNPFGGYEGVRKVNHTFSTGGYVRIGDWLQLEQDKTYTFSYFFKNNTVPNPYDRWRYDYGTLVEGFTPFEQIGGQSITMDNPYPNGWYKQIVTFTPNYNQDYQINFSQRLDQEVQGSYYLYGFQVETYAGATSYIPTSTAVGIREPDDVVIEGTNFSNFFNQSEGTLLFNNLHNDYIADVYGEPVPTPVVWHLTESPVTGWAHGVFRTTDQSGGVLFRDDGSGGLGVNDGNYPNFKSLKSIFSYNSTNRFAAVNGGPVGSSTVSENNIYNELLVGQVDTWGQYGYLNRPISRIIYWPRRLADNILQQLTQ